VSYPGSLGVITNDMLKEIHAQFDAEHRRLYGYELSGEPVEYVAFRVTSVGPFDSPKLPRRDKGHPTSPAEHRDVYFRLDGSWRSVKTSIFRRDSLPAGFAVAGPAVIEEPTSTTVVHPSHWLEVDEYGNLVIHTTPESGQA
jgi:N-methylhydantoinase A